MQSRTVYVASDHAGFELKSQILSRWSGGFKSRSGESNEIDVVWKFSDLGSTSADRVDYPDFAHQLSHRVLAEVNLGTRGILICGSGQGMAISANRHRGIRAALIWNVESARLARSHNDANVLCLGARLISIETVAEILPAFFGTPFEGGRHLARVHKIETDPKS